MRVVKKAYCFVKHEFQAVSIVLILALNKAQTPSWVRGHAPPTPSPGNL